MIDCSTLVESVCDAFRADLFRMCLVYWQEALSYRSIVCELNYDCCADA